MFGTKLSLYVFIYRLNYMLIIYGSCKLTPSHTLSNCRKMKREWDGRREGGREGRNRGKEGWERGRGREGRGGRRKLKSRREHKKEKV